MDKKFSIEYNLNPPVYYLTVADLDNTSKVAIFVKTPEDDSWGLLESNVNFDDFLSMKKFLEKEIGLKINTLV